MKKKLAIFVVLMLLISLTAGATQVTILEPLVAAPIYQAGGMIDETPQAWFVELAGCL